MSGFRASLYQDTMSYPAKESLNGSDASNVYQDMMTHNTETKASRQVRISYRLPAPYNGVLTSWLTRHPDLAASIANCRAHLVLTHGPEVAARTLFLIEASS